jgi:two-component system OmpR family response regulator
LLIAVQSIKKEHDFTNRLYFQTMSANTQRLCIIDDDKDYGEFLADFLRSQGLEVDLFCSGADFIRDGAVERYEFFLIDLGLPGIDGVDLIILIRAKSKAGIIIISGRMGPDAFNSGLSAGADMFLNKPVRFDQVLQAIKTVSRRVSNGDVGQTSWSLNVRAGELKCSNGLSTQLTALELRMLQALAEAGEGGIDRKSLGVSIGMQGAMQETDTHRNLDAAIFRLRKKIEQATKSPAPIRTLHAIGYSIIGRVSID